VRILHSQGVDFASINILDYPAIRDGVKKFSDWPTIPQVNYSKLHTDLCLMVVLVYAPIEGDVSWSTTPARFMLRAHRVSARRASHFRYAWVVFEVGANCYLKSNLKLNQG
jgi:Glutaredoxin